MSSIRQFNEYKLQLQEILNQDSETVSNIYLTSHKQLKIIANGTKLSFLTKKTGAGEGEGEGTMTKACLGAGAGRDRQSCHRHGHSGTRAWGHQSEADQGPMEGFNLLYRALFSVVKISLHSWPTLFSSW